MSGKTWVCSAKVHDSALEHPGIWWLICRYSGTETDNQLRPVFVDVCQRLGTKVEWNADESAYVFPEKDGKVSKVFAYGLKTQSKEQRFAKVRGSGVAGVWNDQSEETPEDIAGELRALVRQPDYPHQLIFSPNPPNEEHFLADEFPDEGALPPGRKLYRLSLYDNKHNLPADTIERLETQYPKTHAKNKSLIYGLRGPNITGTPVYDGAFDRTLHLAPLGYDPQTPLLEAFIAGKHHPSWLVAQRTPLGSLQILGGILGKRLFLEEFLPIVDRYREDWFPLAHDIRTCCDPIATADTSRYTPMTILREHGVSPRSREHGNAPDVRVSMIEHVGALMRRRAGNGQAFLINNDPTRWLMASHVLVKQTKLFVDSCEGSYVWGQNYVSVAHLSVRQPLFDQWLDGWQRCLENLVLNFCAGQRTQAEQQQRRRRRGPRTPSYGTSLDYMA